MSFYKSIATYYDDIFSPSENQISFIKNTIGNPPKDVLDLACGTGSLAIKLSQLGYDVTGIDLDEQMIKVAQNKTQDVLFLNDNMLTFNHSKKYDGIYCIGNSLVHLNSLAEITMFFLNVKTHLKENGTITIQIINYDRILKNKIDHLPTIYNVGKNLTFVRKYQYDKKNHKIIFMTELKVKDLLIKNTVNLYPLTSTELKLILNKAGFKDINLYGDFAFNKYEEATSYALIVNAKC